MLKLKKNARSQEKFEIFKQFDCSISTWIVPDLVSKQAVQRQLLKDKNFVEDDSCLRASDLWRKLLFSSRPEMRIVSPSLVNCLIGDWLSDSEFEWARRPGASQLMQRYLVELMPLLSHPEGEHLVPSWFKENPSAFIRWGFWYHEAKRLWKKFDEYGLAAKEWISGFLVNETNIQKYWSRPLVFDLGVEALASEIELIKNLARFLDVTVLVPYPSWIDEYPALSSRYNSLEDVAPATAIGGGKGSQGSSLEYRSFPSSLGEIKDAVSVVRTWIEQGVKPEKIAILSPNKKPYTSSLLEFLAQEGIPVRQENADIACAHANISRWISRLSLFAGNVDAANLEMDMFFPQQISLEKIKYDDFRVQYSHLYSAKDIFRNKEVGEVYSQSLNSKKVLGRNEFINLIIEKWDKAWNQDPLERVLQNLLQDVPEWLELNTSSWFRYLFDLVRHIDLPSEDSTSAGIHFENVFNAEYLPLTHIYLLGACDSLLRQVGRTGISEQDIQSLSRFAGFNLSASDAIYREFSIKWLAETQFEKMIISYGRSNMSGKQEAPAALWIQGRLSQGLDLKTQNLAGTTRWDEIQSYADSSSDEKIKIGRNYDAAKLFSRLRVDFAEEASILPSFAGKFRLSATALKNYNQCPFVFWSENLMRLNTNDPVDFDLSFRDISNLLHGALDEFGKRGFPEKLSDEEIDKIIGEQIKEQKITVIDWDLWQIQKRSFYPYFKLFLQTEREWRRKFPQTQTLGAEVPFDVYVDLNTSELTLDKGEGKISLSGRIDRIDGDSHGNAVVIDYKRSGSDLSSYSSWLEKRLYQPLLYALVVEKGFTKLGVKNVVSGQFYVLKDGDRSKSFLLKENADTLYDLSGAARNKITVTQKEEMLQQLQGIIVETGQKVRAGKFLPMPADPINDCKKCRWRTVCRAPHLL